VLGLKSLIRDLSTYKEAFPEKLTLKLHIFFVVAYARQQFDEPNKDSTSNNWGAILGSLLTISVITNVVLATFLLRWKSQINTPNSTVPALPQQETSSSTQLLNQREFIANGNRNDYVTNDDHQLALSLSMKGQSYAVVVSGVSNACMYDNHVCGA
jgi:hypothetical protein